MIKTVNALPLMALKRVVFLIALISTVGTSLGDEIVSWTRNTDDNWNMPSNWSTGSVPGTNLGECVVLTGGHNPVVATVVETTNSCGIQLDPNSSLEINSGLLLVDDFILSGGDVLHLDGEVQVNGDLNIISNPSEFRATGGSLTVTGETLINRGVFSVERDTQIFQTTDLTVNTNGKLRFDFDKREINTIEVTNLFSIASGAELEIDLTDYTMGSNEIELVKFGSVTGSFNPADITIIGLGGGVITMDEDSLNLTVIDDVADRSNSLWFVATGGTDGEALDLQVNTGRRIRNLSSPDMTYSLTTDGDEKVYSAVWSGSDFDGDGSNDTVSFDLRVQGFAGSSFSYDSTTESASMTSLGSASNVNGNGQGWSVGGENTDLDAGETLRFKIENLSVSTSGGFVEGFTGISLAEPSGGNNHVLIVGEGQELEVFASNFGTNEGINLVDELLVTSAADSRVNVGQVVFKIRVSELPDFLDSEPGDYSHYPTGPQHRTEYAPVTNLNYPEWTWDTLPMSASAARNDAIPADMAETLANTYQMMSLGGRNFYGEDDVEAGMAAASAAVKAHNPNIFTVGYENAGLHHDRTAANEFFDEDEWTIYSLDENGERVYDMIRLWRRYNHNHPQCREWWSNWVVERLQDPNIDGMFIDKGEGGQDKLLNDNGELETISNRVKSYVSIFERLPEGDMLTGNTIRSSRFGGSRELLHMFNGAYSEGWHNGFSDGIISMSDADARAYAIQLFREAQLKGVIMDPNYHQLRNLPITGDEARALIANGETERVLDEIRTLVKLPLAYHLIAVEENTGYFSFQVTTTDQFVGDEELLWNTKAYVDEFKNPLGAPLGPPQRDGYIFTRSFEHVDVWLNVETEECRLTWDWMPIADEQNVRAVVNTDKSINLSGSNPLDDEMTYAIRDLPEHGQLVGTAPNLTYIPDPDFVGSDSFTFKTYNGMSSSLRSTVTIEVGQAPTSEILLGYDFDNGRGVRTFSANVISPYMEGSSFDVGEGLSRRPVVTSANALAEMTDAEGFDFGTANAFSFGGTQNDLGYTNMDGEDDLDLAITNGDYLTFRIAPSGLNQFSLSSLSFRTRVEQIENGANRWALFTSIDGFESGQEVASGETLTEDQYVGHVIDLSGNGYDDLQSPVEFRIYIYGGGEATDSETLFDKIVVRGNVLSTEDSMFEGYAKWAFDNNQNDVDADPTLDDMDGDGYVNLQEYVLLGDPNLNDSSSIAPVMSTNENGVTSYTFLRRSESVIDTTQTIKYGSDLSDWDEMVISGDIIDPRVTITPQADGVEEVSVDVFSVFDEDAEKVFFQLSIEPKN